MKRYDIYGFEWCATASTRGQYLDIDDVREMVAHILMECGKDHLTEHFLLTYGIHETEKENWL